MTAVDPEGRIRHPLDVFHSTLEPDGDFVPAGYIPQADGLGHVEYVDSATLGGAPASADYLVGTANGTLSSEIVVGTTPGGELGGTWSSPTVDATHAGTNHLQPVRKNSAGTVFERRRLNLIEGSNVTLTVADDSGNDEVDITIAATGGGGGSLDLAGDTGTAATVDDITFIGAGGIAVDVNDLGGGAAEVTIDGSGVSGGGGGSDFYSGPSGSGQIIIPGFQGDGRRLPTSPNGSDREFDTGLSTGTTVGSATVENAHSFRPSNYYVKRSATSTSLTGRYWAWSPAAGGIVTTVQTGFMATRGGNARSGLAVGAASPTAWLTWGLGWSTSWGLRVDGWSSPTAYASTPFNGTGLGAESDRNVYFRIRYNSSTSIDFEYSWDGFLWVTALAGHNPGFTVGSVGLFVDPESSDVHSTWDFVRFS